ncbi:MAG: hypothetical protein R3298_11690 [Gammaproteobacteria bacterium]|nr:hypothetical protein [Gammaproteobacteria bacterium]
MDHRGPGVTGRRREAALHEAAHAVVACLHGLEVQLVSIVPEDGSDGIALHRNPWHDLPGTPADTLHAALVAAEVSYAGELAVQAFLGRPGSGNDDDLLQITTELQRVCTTREQLLLMARWVEQRVRDRLREPGVRAAVGAVADALEEEGTLDRARFHRLVAMELALDTRGRGAIPKRN